MTPCKPLFMVQTKAIWICHAHDPESWWGRSSQSSRHRRWIHLNGIRCMGWSSLMMVTLYQSAARLTPTTPDGSQMRLSRRHAKLKQAQFLGSRPNPNPVQCLTDVDVAFIPATIVTEVLRQQPRFGLVLDNLVTERLSFQSTYQHSNGQLT